MERLRYVARAGGVPVVPLVREAAAALSYFADDPMALVTACRRLLERHRNCGPLVWLAARMVSALDPRLAACEAVAALKSDPTVEEFQDALPAGATVLVPGHSETVTTALSERPDCRLLVSVDPGALVTVDLVVMESDCLGRSGALVATECINVAEEARVQAVPVWLLAGVGRVLPEPMWKACQAVEECQAGNDHDAAGSPDQAVLNMDRLVTAVVTPKGLLSPTKATQNSTCPVVLELFTQ